MKEFYPTPATKMSRREALEHCIRKWEGVLPKNLKKHEVLYSSHEIIDGDDDDYFLQFNSDTCALCTLYGHSWHCDGCPIKKSCNLGSAHINSADDPKPMLRVLKAALKKEMKDETV